MKQKKLPEKLIFMLANLGSGGAERVVSILSAAFSEKGIAVDIVQFLSDSIQYTISPGVNIVTMNTRDMTKAQRIRCLRDYFNCQKKNAGKIVVIPFQDNCLKYALLASAGLGISVIACERNDPHRKGRSGKGRLLANIPFLLAKHAVFQTPDARDYYCRAVRKKSTIIFNPLQLAQDLKWQGQHSTRIVSVGRLEPQKNQKILLDAFVEICREFPQYTLDIYGEGVLRTELEAQIAQLQLQDAVSLRGYSPDIHKILSESAMFVLSSDYEGMSNALMEALAIGVPTVSTDHPIGGARLLIQNDENGLLTPVGDVKGLVQAMGKLIRDPRFAWTMGAKATAVRDLLSVDTIIGMWLEVISA